MNKNIERLKTVLSDPKKIIVYLNRLIHLNFLSDKHFHKIMYWSNTGCHLNLKNPKGFNEKLHWLMIHDHNPIYTTLVDKYKVKEYVKSKIGENYVIPLINAYKTVDEINFDDLPNKFVLKWNNTAIGMCICKDKSKLNYNHVKKELAKGYRWKTYYRAREWPYKNVESMIVCEYYMENVETVENNIEGLVDYKFYCFNGIPKFLYVGCANFINNEKHDLLSFYDMDFNKVPFYRIDHKPLPFEIKKPICFEEMKSIAKKLSEGMPFVRVDLYQIGLKVYFGELTFYPGAGFGIFYPNEWEEQIGSWIDLSKIK